MIWSCFWVGEFGLLVFNDGTVNQDIYVNILAKEFLPWFIELNKKENDKKTAQIPDFNPI
ncbi:hypothetical protein BDF14DRAFT_1829680, partial [Spinellus fusiger]